VFHRPTPAAMILRRARSPGAGADAMAPRPGLWFARPRLAEGNALAETRRYERIDIQLPCRLYVPAEGGGLRFEAFTTTRNLGLGGIFLESSFLLRAGLEIWAELALPSGPLAVRGRVVHAVPLEHRSLSSGMGLEFLGVDLHGRETLLRYFTPVRYREFHAALIAELPHLKKDLPLSDVSLVLNLWEEWKARLETGSPPATVRPGRRSRREPPLTGRGA